MLLEYFDYQVIIDNIPLLIKGLKTTLVLCVFGNFFSLVLGTIIGIGKVSKIKFISVISSVYVEIFRNTPLLVQVYFFYLYFGNDIDPLISGLCGLCTYTSSYMTEVIRAGIQSVPETELMAADALGLNPIEKITKIVLPQAFRIILPPMTNQFMNLTKNTSIVYFITVADITYIFETLSAQTFRFFELFIVTALLYMIICWIIAIISSWIEHYIYVPGLSSIEVELEH